jgi:hypothetical protein
MLDPHTLVIVNLGLTGVVLLLCAAYALVRKGVRRD